MLTRATLIFMLWKQIGLPEFFALYRKLSYTVQFIMRIGILVKMSSNCIMTSELAASLGEIKVSLVYI